MLSPRTLREGRGLPAYAAFVVAFMVLIIAEGAIVRATGSGNGCGSHWPLCNNQIIPHHPRLATIIEFTHRSLTGVCVALVTLLIAWTFLATPRGHRARPAAIWTGVLLLTEGALGAVLVLGGYVERNASNARVLVQSVHFTNTMLLLAAMTATWRYLSPNRTPLQLQTPSRPILWSALLAVMLTGATGSVAALADTIFPSPTLHQALAQDFNPTAPLLIHMRWMHPATAAISFFLIALLATRLRPSRHANTLYTLLAVQIILGTADVLLLAPTTLQVLHLIGADMLWIALISLSTEALKPAPAASQPSPTSEPLIAH